MLDTLTKILLAYSSNGKNTGICYINKLDRKEFHTYTELYIKAKKLLEKLYYVGLRENDELIFQFDNNKTFIITFWACLLGKIKAIPVHPANTPEQRQKVINVWSALENPRIIADETVYQNLKSKLDPESLPDFTCEKLISYSQLAQFELNQSDPFSLPEIHEDDIAFIQFSSGSTGNPKGVVLTHKNLLTNIRDIIEGAQLSENDSTLGWMPLTHDLGLIGFHLVPLVRGINQYIIPTDVFVRRPTIWWNTINEYRITFTASPNFGYQHFLSFFKKDIAEKWDLSCVKRILNGAEPISAKLCETFLEKMAPYGLKNTTMFPVYGMAEASLGVAFPEIDRKFSYLNVDRDHLNIGNTVRFTDEGLSFVKVGQKLTNCSYRITYKNETCTEGIIGEIEIKGDNVTKGYYNNPEANQKLFTQDGWLKTGDLGFEKNGYLYITGRIKDIIFSNGLNIYPHDVERIIEESTNAVVGKVIVCGVPNSTLDRDEVIAFIHFRGKIEDFAPLAEEIKTIVNRKLSFPLDVVLPIKKIEKTTSGKVKRFFYVEEYKKGTYTEIHQTLTDLIYNAKASKNRVLPSNEREEKMLTIWSEVLETPENLIGIHENFFELGGNSLKANLLLGKVARLFNVQLTIREAFKYPTIASLASFIEDKATQNFSSIPKVSERQFYPASSTQKRMFILHQLDPNSVSYNISAVFKMVGKVDHQKLTSSFRKLIAKHTALRTYFDVIEGTPVQKVAEDVDFELINVPFKKDVDSTMDSIVKPFDLTQYPLFRLHISADDKSHEYLLFDIHHSIADGFSLNLLVKELSVIYNSTEDKAASPEGVNYIDFSLWQEDFMQSEQMQESKAFWLKSFEGEIPKLDLPTDFPRQKTNLHRGESITFHFDKADYQQIKTFVKNEQSTFYLFFLTVLNSVLVKYTGQHDIVIGTPVASRPHADLIDTFGPFVNTLALRNEWREDQNFKDFHQTVKEQTLTAYSHQDFPFEQLVEMLNIDRDLSRNALFDVMFVLQNANTEKLTLGSANVEQVPYFNGATKLDLNIHAWENEDGFKFRIEYPTALFTKERMERFSNYFKHFVQAVCKQPTLDLSSFSLPDEQEKQLLINTFNETEKSFSIQNALDLFNFHLKQNKDSKAVVAQGKTFSFSAIDQCVNHYADVLKEKGVQSGDFIGINTPPSEQFIIALLATWKVGAAFVPLDPSNPVERNQFIVKDSGIKYVFGLSISPDVEAISIDPTVQNESFVESKLGFDSPAYVIYTSGTTGQPKGTVIRHGALANYVQSIGEKHQLSNKDASVLLTSYAFDLGYTAIFGALLNGGSIHFIADEQRKEAAYLIDYLVDQNITFFKTTPSQLFTLVNAVNANRFSESKVLKKIFIGGEAIKTDDLKKVHALNSNIKFINHYGPTETTIGCLTYPVEDLDAFARRPVIGKPIHNTQVVILDKYKQLVPIGVEGEIHVGGAGLAVNYLNRENDYAERFITHTLIPNKKLYATGDVGKWTRDGAIEFCGRNDDQVKIRGYRVELKGVKEAISTLSGVKEVALITQKDNTGNTELIAYVVGDEKTNIKVALSNILPEYMIPSHIMWLEELPITANGKLDKKRLPAIKKSNSANRIKAKTSEQKIVVEIWQDVLGIKEDIGINENFFELGGHSLKATIVIAKIHKALDVQLPLKTFFSHPTIAKLSEVIAQSTKNPYAAIKPVEEREWYPVSSAQKRMFVLHELEGEATSYNMPGAFWVDGPLDITRLEATFEGLIKKHESLRTSFFLKEGNPVQQIETSFSFKVERLTHPNGDTDQLIKQFIRPFDLSQAPLFRVGVWSISNTRHLLLFDIHHIISDGTSMGLIIEDFIQLYDTQKTEPLAIQYKDFAVWQQDFFNSDYLKKQQEYWVEQFKNEDIITDLPTDFERPKTQQFDGASFNFKFDETLTTQLKKVCEEHDLTLFMLLNGIYSIFLAHQTGSEKFTVGTPVAGRPHADLQKIIGVFLNTLVIKSEPEHDKTIRDFLQEIKQTALVAYENQDFPFHELVEALKLDRKLDRNPLFDTMLVVQNMNVGDLKTKELTFEQHEFDLGSTQVDMSWIVFDNGKTLDFTVNFNTKLFKEATVRSFVDRLNFVAHEVTAKINEPIKAVNLMPEKVQEAFLKDFNNYQLEYDAHQEVFSRIKQQVVEQGDSVAIIDGKNTFTFNEIWEHSNQLAYLLQEKLPEKGTIIPVVLERSVNIVISILGILKSGNAYVFIDPNYPEERIKFMLEDSMSDLMITQKSLLNEIEFSGEPLIIDEVGLYENAPKTDLPLDIKADDLAYLIYTSGSTGKPKGVMLAHQNLNAFIAWAHDEFKHVPFEMVYNTTSYAFDLSVFELFYTLSSGKKLRILQDGLEIANFLPKDNNVMLNTVPSVVKALLSQQADLSNVVAINMAGEPIARSIKEDLDLEKIEVRNLYGPSEDTTYSTINKIRAANSVQNIGKPIANTQLYILDKSGKTVPAGVAGELCLSGDGIALGYHNRPELTSEKFITHPFLANKKLYKTGDLAKWTADGEVIYLGRIDQQVKIRGFRVELGEIESRLAQHSEIKDVVVTDLEHKDSGEKFLCAYYVSRDGSSCENLRAFLAAFLPTYMLPSAFVLLEKIPTLPNGKTNKKALPYPSFDGDLVEELVLPTDEVENHLLEAWKQVLEVNEIGINSNFFSLGGDSIKAIQVVAKLQPIGIKFEVRQLFEYPTIAELAPHVEVKKNTIDQSPLTGNYPLSPVQRHFFACDFEEAHHWNQSIMLKSKERLDANKLQKALHTILVHHDVLRSAFKNGQATILSIDDLEVPLEVVELSDEKQIFEVAEKAQSTLNLSDGKVLKAILFKTLATDHLLLIAHHLVVDGISWRVLTHDLETVYDEGQLPLKTTSFSDWNAALEKLAKNENYLEKERTYWRENSGFSSSSMASSDIENNVKDAVKHLVQLDESLTKELLGEANTAYNTSANDLLLTALSRAVYQWKQLEKCAVTLEGHGRENIVDDVDISRTVGWFTSMFPVQLSHKNELRDHLVKTKDHLNKIPDKGMGYFMLKYLANEKLEPLPEISFNYLGVLDNTESHYFTFSELPTGSTLGENNKRNHLLDFNLYLKNGVLNIELTYNSLAFTSTEIADLLTHYTEALKAINAHCLSKEEIEVTATDMSFDISSDDFDNIF